MPHSQSRASWGLMGVIIQNIWRGQCWQRFPYRKREVGAPEDDSGGVRRGPVNPFAKVITQQSSDPIYCNPGDSPWLPTHHPMAEHTGAAMFAFKLLLKTQFFFEAFDTTRQSSGPPEMKPKFCQWHLLACPHPLRPFSHPLHLSSFVVSPPLLKSQIEASSGRLCYLGNHHVPSWSSVRLIVSNKTHFQLDVLNIRPAAPSLSSSLFISHCIPPSFISSYSYC